MKIQCTYATAATQIHTGKCYFIGFSIKDGKAFSAYNVETSGSAATGNLVCWGDEGLDALVLPKPGIECTNGLYVVPAGDNPCVVFWSTG